MWPASHHGYAVLEDTRTKATKSGCYSSDKTRSDITKAFKSAFNGLKPYTWPLDVCEALLLGLDCIVIAGTGAGKTMPFIMPLLVDETKKNMAIIISPLNALEHDQVYHVTILCSAGSLTCSI
jgi:ATP-dependent helicase YprA (DUF1998 family)